VFKRPLPWEEVSTFTASESIYWPQV
jgi:hypothetical protein